MRNLIYICALLAIFSGVWATEMSYFWPRGRTEARQHTSQMVTMWELRDGNLAGIFLAGFNPSRCVYQEWDRGSLQTLRSIPEITGCTFGAPLRGGGLLMALSSNAIMKWDSNLELAWAQTYVDGELVGLKSIIELNDGSILVLATSLVSKLDSDGNVLWRKPFAPERPAAAGTQMAEVEELSVVVVALDGNKVVRAYKFDADGNLLWEKKLSNRRTKFSQIVPVLASDGNYIVALSTDNLENRKDKEVTAFKLSPDGSTLWARTVRVPQTLGSGERLGGLVAEDDGGAVLVATSTSGRVGEKTSPYREQGGREIWLVKLSCNGEVVWDLSAGMSPYWEISYARKTMGGYIVGTPTPVEIVTNELRKVTRNSRLKPGDVISIFSREAGKYLAVDTDSDRDLVKANRDEDGIASQWMILKDPSQAESRLYLRSLINGKRALLTRTSSDVEMRASADHNSAPMMRNEFEVKYLGNSTVAIQSSIRSFGYLRPEGGSELGKIIATESKASEREMELTLIHQRNPLVRSDIILRLSSKNVLIEANEQGLLKATNTVLDESNMDAYTFTVVGLGKYGRVGLISKASGRYLFYDHKQGWRMNADGTSGNNIYWRLAVYADGYTALYPNRLTASCVMVTPEGEVSASPTAGDFESCKMMVAQVV
ncbi:hypothetical protein NDN08_000006 [Rhodosorus marinus]|uniref:ER membrane protein complex subunit 1 n=1 Tax=Rhodosorus marinus TaxID=101924 RepID=A0AAV8UDX5_9RHOD|nr:hypothetical protein NDN08_000006 [Rhodosorus marinus]